MFAFPNALALLLFVAHSAAHSQTISPKEQCANDLKFIPDYLIKNDAGGKDHLDRLGQLHFDQAMARASARLDSVKAIWDCGDILAEYLRAWRHGHLWVENFAKPIVTPAAESIPQTKVVPAVTQSNDKPTLKRLSKSTSLLLVPSFAGNKQEAIVDAVEKLVFVYRTPNWVVDVRQNGGGADSSWQTLAALISGRSVRLHNMWMLATDANRVAWPKMCEVARFVDPISCKLTADSVVDRLSTAKQGSWISMIPDGNSFKDVDLSKIPVKPAHRPKRVAILIDKACGSSCEQFLLFAKQSPRVKLIGRPTFGALDYSNMIPVSLPSGNYLMFYAGTRSSRLPHFPVDVSGIQPDIYLDPPKTEAEREAEITFAQRFLETQ